MQALFQIVGYVAHATDCFEIPSAKEGISALHTYCNSKSWKLFAVRPKGHMQQEIMKLGHVLSCVGFCACSAWQVEAFVICIYLYIYSLLDVCATCVRGPVWFYGDGVTLRYILARAGTLNMRICRRYSVSSGLLAALSVLCKQKMLV